MSALEGNFSKIVRSLLLDVDVHLDQLEQIGYLSKEQRAFLDKFLYKSEVALRAVTLIRGFHGSDALLTKLPSPEESSPSRSPLSPKLSTAVSNATSRVLPRLRSATEKIKSEENGLTTFLKRCNARNFSVKVRGSDFGNESPSKVKGSDYILTLEPIAEGNAKAGGGNAKAELDSGKPLEHVNYDTNMMLHGTDALARSTSGESIDFETLTHTDAITERSPDEVEHTVNEAIDIEATEVDSVHQMAVESRAVIAETVEIEPALKSIKVDLAHADATNLKLSQIELGKVDITTTNVAVSNADNENIESYNIGQLDIDTLGDTAEKIETNTSRKPVKSDPTRNKEGAIVGGAAKPLGAENRGRAMMERMGWSNGTGLGKQNGGILEPITHVVKTSKAGLHSSDEKKRKLHSKLPFGENAPEPLLVVEKPIDSGLPNDGKSDCEKALETSDWENSTKVTAEQIQFIADWDAAKKHAEDINRAEAEAAKGKSKGPFKGIQALYIRGAEDPGPEKTIKFRSKIQSTSEYKTTKHYPGVVIKATSTQPGDFLNQKNGFKVSYGHHLEVLRAHQGDEFHVFNFNQKKRGIVKVSLLEMIEEIEAPAADVASWANNPVAATN